MKFLIRHTTRPWPWAPCQEVLTRACDNECTYPQWPHTVHREAPQKILASPWEVPTRAPSWVAGRSFGLFLWTLSGPCVWANHAGPLCMGESRRAPVYGPITRGPCVWTTNAGPCVWAIFDYRRQTFRGISFFNRDKLFLHKHNIIELFSNVDIALVLYLGTIIRNLTEAQWMWSVSK